MARTFIERSGGTFCAHWDNGEEKLCKKSDSLNELIRWSRRNGGEPILDNDMREGLRAGWLEQY